MKITIAPDFEKLLPPLGEDELAQLERNVLDDPDHERMPPIIVWSNHKNTIVDGHNQYRIRSKHNLKPKFVGINFETRDEALHYGAAVQLGRRNLTASQRAFYATKYPKPGSGEKRTECASTEETTAKQAGVSRRTLQQAKAVNGHAPASVKRAIAEGKVSVADASKVLDQPPAKQAAAVKAVEKGEAGSLVDAFDRILNGDDEPAAKKQREWGEGDSLEDIQADIKEIKRRCLDLSKFVRTVLRCEGNEITRPYCGLYSLMTVSHPILHIGRTVMNDMPVGGTSKKPVLFHEQKANSIG